MERGGGGSLPEAVCGSKAAALSIRFSRIQNFTKSNLIQVDVGFPFPIRKLTFSFFSSSGVCKSFCDSNELIKTYSLCVDMIYQCPGRIMQRQLFDFLFGPLLSSAEFLHLRCRLRTGRKKTVDRRTILIIIECSCLSSLPVLGIIDRVSGSVCFRVWFMAHWSKVGWNGKLPLVGSPTWIDRETDWARLIYSAWTRGEGVLNWEVVHHLSTPLHVPASHSHTHFSFSFFFIIITSQSPIPDELSSPVSR